MCKLTNRPSSIGTARGAAGVQSAWVVVVDVFTMLTFNSLYKYHDVTVVRSGQFACCS